jgi:hypothetical protein
MVNNIWMFLVNVGAHWTTLPLGGVLGMAILLVEHKLKHSLSWKVLWYILAGALFISCFLAWQDEHHNAEVLKDQKADVTSERNVLQAKLESKQDQINQMVVAQSIPRGNEATEKARRPIQDKLSRYIDSGNSLRNKFIPGVHYPEKEQHEWALFIQSWHKDIATYLKTIPRGNIYLARFHNQLRSNAAYPGGGMTPEWYDHWDLLSSDMARLEEFLQDHDIGAP